MVQQKIYEIPIYAFAPEKLKEKVQEQTKRIIAELSDTSPQNIKNKLISLGTYPMCLWDYNHIVGYIRIFVSRNDVWFDVFLPEPPRKKYYWIHGRKIFLHDSMINGFHFYVSDEMNNEKISQKICEMLSGLEKLEDIKRYYVDRRTFDNTYKYLDYKTIMKLSEDKANGQVKNANGEQSR